MLITIVIVLVFLMMFWQGHMCVLFLDGVRWCKYDIFCCGDLREKLKFKTYLTMTIMLCISNGLIFIAHIFGYFVVKNIFGMDVFYTWRTSLAGFIIYIIIIVCGLIAFGLWKLYGYMINVVDENFSDDVYGVVIEQL
jgi:sterol desaturase/sphingolipid hydroxylase (fatty acid hydroxylase superfamily)